MADERLHRSLGAGSPGRACPGHRSFPSWWAAGVLKTGRPEQAGSPRDRNQSEWPGYAAREHPVCRREPLGESLLDGPGPSNPIRSSRYRQVRSTAISTAREETLDRQVRMFGPETVELLRGLRVAVVGCDGTGGERLQLSLAQEHRPRWKVGIDWLGRPTVTPSIRMRGGWRAHFHLRGGRLEWCKDSGR